MRRSLFAVVGLLSAMAACSDQDKSAPRVSGANPDPLALASDFVRTECSAPPAYTSPPQGSVITSKLFLADGGTASRTVRVVSAVGSRTGIRSEMRVAGLASPIAPQSVTLVEFGILPAGQIDQTGGLIHSYEYTQDPTASLTNLAVGETAKLDVVEKVLAGAAPGASRHIFEVTLVACGRLKEGWDGTPVRVYRTITSNRNTSSDSATANPIIRTATLSYMSDQHGWYLRRQGTHGGYEVVEAISRP